jgi:hypothetical protein
VGGGGSRSGGGNVFVLNKGCSATEAARVMNAAGVAVVVEILGSPHTAIGHL